MVLVHGSKILLYTIEKGTEYHNPQRMQGTLMLHYLIIINALFFRLR